jgi:hypothetical protein
MQAIMTRNQYLVAALSKVQRPIDFEMTGLCLFLALVVIGSPLI